jgi:hypothetical protein
MQPDTVPGQPEGSTPGRPPDAKVEGAVLITGTPRSGKSLLGNILKHAPEFHYVGESVSTWDEGMPRRGDDCRDATEATEAVRARIVEACHTCVERHGRRRYLDNLSQHALRLPFVHAVMPEARIIHVIRDGCEAIPEMMFGWMHRDTVHMAVRRRWRTIRLSTAPRLLWRFAHNYFSSRVSGRRHTFGARPPGLAEFAANHSVAEVAAYQWEQILKIAMRDLATLPADAWIEVRFDRLIADPRGTIRRVAKFCEVEDVENLVARAASYVNPECDRVFEKRVGPEEVERVRQLFAADLDSIRQRIAPLQAKLGYDVA